MRWQLRCARNTLAAALPFQRRLRALKRRLSGRAHHIHEASVYSGGFDQIRLLREAGLELRGATVLELGTGWYPVIPLMLRLAGARQVILTDVHALMDRQTLEAALDFLLERREDLAGRLDRPVAEIEAALALAPETLFADALARLGLVYRVPFDVGHEDCSADAIISHTVLEHIPPTVLERIFRQSHATLRSGGLISHGIDHSDHRAHQDPRLGRIDFLRHGETTWRLLCLNPQDYTNRLRHPDYVAMIGQAGFETVIERPLVDDGARASLADLPLAPRFRGYDGDGLATTWSHIVARPVD